MEIDLERINDSDHLLDTLISCENVLDSLDAYCFTNVFSGEVVGGPIVRPYWTTIMLLYPYNKMPDPRFALRLLKHGIQVEYARMKRETPDGETKTQSDWLVTISFPKRLLDSNEENDLKVYADDVNPDDVTTAKDAGLDNESQYKADEQDPNAAPNAAPPDEETPNQQPPP
jgi:hypothetical protein